MKLSGIKSYLSKPSRAVIASVAATVLTVLLMFVFKPLFPEQTAIYRTLSVVGAAEIEAGEYVDVTFDTFTDFDTIGVAVYADSPSKEYELKLIENTDNHYVVRITNSGNDTLKLLLESPEVYKSIEPYNETGTIDINLNVNGSPNGNVFIFVTFFTALFVFFVTFAYLTDNLSPSKFYLIGALTLGLGAYPVLFPAWCAHDADAHFQAVYRFSNILLGKGGDWVGRECDVEFFRGSWKRFVFEGGYRPDPASDMYLPVIMNNKMFVSGDQTAIVASDGGDYAYMLFYSIFNYLPLVLGFVIGRLINLSPMYMIHLARYLQGALFVFITWRAIKKVKSENVAYLLTLVSLFPMSLAYLTAFSYDGAVLTYLICGIAMLYGFTEDEKFWNKKNIIEVLIWFFLIGSVKGGAYVIMIPMIFMLIKKPLKDRRNLLPIALTAIAFLAMGLCNVVLKPKGEDLFQLTGDDGFYSASFALYHPFKYLVMCAATLFVFAGDIITDSVGRSEGWNEVAIPGIIIVFILIATITCTIASSKSSKITRSQVISFVIACVLLLIGAPAMLLHDTPVGNDIIMGVQGRYFRPLAPLIIMLIAGICEVIGSKLEKKSMESLTSKSVAIKNISLVVFAIGSVAAIIAMNSLYLGR